MTTTLCLLDPRFPGDAVAELDAGVSTVMAHSSYVWSACLGLLPTSERESPDNRFHHPALAQPSFQ
jgi:hypothetical protein